MISKAFLFLFFVVALTLPTTTVAQDGMADVEVNPMISGHWTGAIQIQAVELGIQVHFSADGSTIDIPQQGAAGLPLKNVFLRNDSLHFELPAGPGLAIFDGVMGGDSVAGDFKQAGMLGAFKLVRTTAPAKKPAEQLAIPGESVSTPTSGGQLSGTLLVPESAPPFPLVIIVAGSGPTDRDGNSVGLPGKNNSLRLLAEALLTEGIATLRYDKRGIGKSVVAVQESDLRIDSFAVDVERWRRFVADDIRFSHVLLAGHSEGSLLVSMAAGNVDVDGVISIAGAGRPANDVLREQLVPQLAPDKLATVDSIVEALLGGELVSDVPASLNSLFRPSIQPYLISWFALDPAKALGNVSVPKLILHGETDIQVKGSDAERLAAHSPEAFMKRIEGMNHILKNVPADRTQQIASYSDPALPVHPVLVEEIVRFVREVSATSR